VYTAMPRTTAISMMMVRTIALATNFIMTSPTMMGRAVPANETFFNWSTDRATSDAFMVEGYGNRRLKSAHAARDRANYHEAMSESSSINLSSQGPPSTRLPEFDVEARHALMQAMSADVSDRRSMIAEVVKRHPRFIEAWVALGDHGRDDMERYACYRVAYHRGLDSLRQNGWRGSGYVRWSHVPNRGFLMALHRLGTTAAVIGESDEAERCRLFVLQLEPSGVPEGA
jgi:Protein of unknown function (DUF3151)